MNSKKPNANTDNCAADRILLSGNEAIALGARDAGVRVATAYPGTPLYDDLVRQGVRMPDDWSAYSQYSPGFQPLPTRHLPPREVLAFRDAAFEEYLRFGPYHRRIQDCFGVEAVAFLDRILAVRLVRNGNG